MSPIQQNKVQSIHKNKNLHFNWWSNKIFWKCL